MKFTNKKPMPIAKRTAAPAKLGGWLSGEVAPTQERKVKALHPAHHELGVRAPATFGAYSLETNAPNRTLTTEQLWEIYWRCPEVRACVDSIARRVSTWDWNIQVSDMVDVSESAHYEEMVKLSRQIQRFLKNPDRDGRTFQQVMFMLIVDLLVYDAAAIEPVMDRKKRIQELRPRRGDDFRVVTDRYGQVDHYIQSPTSGTSVKFKKNELVYFNLFPNTTYPEGMPIIETVLNEIVTVLRYGQRSMQTADISEIPQGVLVLSGVTGRAAQDAMQDFRNDAGKDHKMRMLHFPSPQAGGAEWINFQNTAKELELNEVIDRIQRTIWRVYGVMPVEMGAVADINRSTAQVQVDVSSSHLLTPILELVEGVFNKQIIPALAKQFAGEDHYDHVEFRFNKEAKLTQKDQEARIDMLGRAIGAGVMTRNEARELLGMLPLGADGDVPTVGEGNMIIRLEDVARGETPFESIAGYDADPDSEQEAEE